jgi:hypothetical protein
VAALSAKRLFFLEVSMHFRSAGALVWYAMETTQKNEVIVYLLYSVNYEIKKYLRFSFDSPKYKKEAHSYTRV